MSGLILGFKIQEFKILPLGFIASFKISINNYNKKILKANILTLKKIFVAIAGPLVNATLIIIFISYKGDFFINISKETLIYINFLILIFNMLPIYPLDGGRILKNIFHIFLGKIFSLQLTSLISKISAILLTILIFFLIYTTGNITYLFMIGYIWILVIKENKKFKLQIKIYKILQNCIAIKQN